MPEPKEASKSIIENVYYKAGVIAEDIYGVLSGLRVHMGRTLPSDWYDIKPDHIKMHVSRPSAEPLRLRSVYADLEIFGPSSKYYLWSDENTYVWRRKPPRLGFVVRDDRIECLSDVSKALVIHAYSEMMRGLIDLLQIPRDIHDHRVAVFNDARHIDETVRVEGDPLNILIGKWE